MFRFPKLAASSAIQANTTYRYVNPNIETARRAPAALDAFNTQEALQPEPVEMVN